MNQALKFMFGHHALRTATYDNYSFIRRLEAGMMADMLMADGKSINRKVTRKELELNKKTFNMAKGMLNLKVALKCWKE